MERFYIKFYMNNGDTIEIEEEQDPSYDFFTVLKSKERWFRHDQRIINLENVNSISIETETSRQQDLENMTNAYTNINF